MPRRIGLSEFLHGLKSRRFSTEAKGQCDEVLRGPLFLKKGAIDVDAFFADYFVQELFDLFDHQILCYKFLDFSPVGLDYMRETLETIRRPRGIQNRARLRELMNMYCRFTEIADSEVKEKMRQLTCEECVRLDEAVVCFGNHAYLASIIMAVSAVETRLHRIVEKADRHLYSSEFERSPIGSLLKIYDDPKYNDEKYKKIKESLPHSHKALIVLLNKYRVVSVHPKEETITPQIAESVLHLSFSFLLDKKTSPYSTRELRCGAQRSPRKRSKGTKAAKGSKREEKKG